LLAAILLATGSGGAEWGSITGTLSDQTDLNTALGSKLNLTGGTLTGGLSFSGTTHAGLRLNNLTTVERNALASPLAGMVLWNTTTSRMNVHNGSAWTDGFVRLAGDTMTGLLTITPSAANTGALAVTGYSLTGSSAVNMIDLAGTWNTSGTPTGIRINITDTASNANSLLMHLLVGGANRVRIFKSGDAYLAGLISATTASFSGNCSAPNFITGADSGGFVAGSGNDVRITRKGAASFQMGLDSATPISQSFGACSGVGTNIAGANFTVTAGPATGNANGGSLLFQTSTVGSSGSTLQTLTTRLIIDATGLIAIPSGGVLRLGNAAVAATPTPTHTVTFQDLTGTTYRIPCVV
jgi:hypothetical protein